MSIETRADFLRSIPSLDVTRQALVAFVLVAVWAGTPFAQARPYNLIMKDVASSFGALRTSVDAGDLTGAREHAGRLEQLFKETEDFWTKFKTKDAINAATGARNASATIVVAAGAKDVQKIKTAAGDLGKFCTACHDSHREQMPDKSYRIRP